MKENKRRWAAVLTAAALVAAVALAACSNSSDSSDSGGGSSASTEREALRARAAAVNAALEGRSAYTTPAAFTSGGTDFQTSVQNAATTIGQVVSAMAGVYEGVLPDGSRAVTNGTLYNALTNVFDRLDRWAEFINEQIDTLASTPVADVSNINLAADAPNRVSLATQVASIGTAAQRLRSIVLQRSELDRMYGFDRGDELLAVTLNNALNGRLTVVVPNREGTSYTVVPDGGTIRLPGGPTGGDLYKPVNFKDFVRGAWEVRDGGGTTVTNPANIGFTAEIPNGLGPALASDGTLGGSFGTNVRNDTTTFTVSAIDNQFYDVTEVRDRRNSMAARFQVEVGAVRTPFRLEASVADLVPTTTGIGGHVWSMQLNNRTVYVAADGSDGAYTLYGVYNSTSNDGTPTWTREENLNGVSVRLYADAADATSGTLAYISPTDEYGMYYQNGRWSISDSGSTLTIYAEGMAELSLSNPTETAGVPTWSEVKSPKDAPYRLTMDIDGGGDVDISITHANGATDSWRGIVSGQSVPINPGERVRFAVDPARATAFATQFNNANRWWRVASGDAEFTTPNEPNTELIVRGRGNVTVSVGIVAQNSAPGLPPTITVELNDANSGGTSAADFKVYGAASGSALQLTLADAGVTLQPRHVYAIVAGKEAAEQVHIGVGSDVATALNSMMVSDGYFFREFTEATAPTNIYFARNGNNAGGTARTGVYYYTLVDYGAYKAGTNGLPMLKVQTLKEKGYLLAGAPSSGGGAGVTHDFDADATEVEYTTAASGRVVRRVQAGATAADVNDEWRIYPPLSAVIMADGTTLQKNSRGTPVASFRVNLGTDATAAASYIVDGVDRDDQTVRAKVGGSDSPWTNPSTAVPTGKQIPSFNTDVVHDEDF